MRFPALVLALVTVFVAAPAMAKEMTFRWASNGETCATCRWIAADGEIIGNTPLALSKFVTREHVAAGTLLRLNSGGGEVQAAVDLGQRIRRAGLNTDVGKTVFRDPGNARSERATFGKGACASACTYTYMGGVDRYLDTGSRIGVHQFYADGDQGNDESAQWTVAGLGYYFTEMGVDPKLLVVAASTPSQTMAWLDRDTLEELRVVTSRRAPAEADWTVAIDGSAMVLKAHQQQKDGSYTDYELACSAGRPDTFHLTTRRKPPPAAERDGLSVRALRIHPEGVEAGSRVSVAEFKVDETELLVGAELRRADVLAWTGQGAAEVYLEFDAARAGPGQRLPLKNLAGDLTVLARNCGA